MCDYCLPILKTFGIPHEEAQCPLRMSMYCSNCAIYGHRRTECPAKPAARYTEPCYLEQLIPPSELLEYGITTRTPIHATVPEPAPQLLEIQDNERVITAYLAARSVKIRKGQTKRQALQEYAMIQRKRVVYLK